MLILPPPRQHIASQPESNDTVLLLHCNGVDTSTVYTDSSEQGHNVTAYGNVQLDIAEKRFGSASSYHASAGDYFDLDGSADFAFGLNDFTIDFWYYPNTLSGVKVHFDCRDPASQADHCAIYSYDDTLYFYVDGNQITASGGLSAGVWQHIAVTRSASLTRLFIDGIQVGSTYSDNNNYEIDANRPRIGDDGYSSSYSVDGWYDEIRVLNGTAAWTGNFTPPTTEYL